MFGWEFPPNISGGLGTACEGMVRGFEKAGGVEVIFVVPKVHGNEEKSNILLIGAGDDPLDMECSVPGNQRVLRKYLRVASNLVPYVTPSDFVGQELFTVEGTGSGSSSCNRLKLNLTGKYGPNLFSEIAAYELAAGSIASKYRFDIIHAHDWLTFPAGIAARKRSGKPLVVHVHATDFDRCAGNPNPLVYKIEQEGMKKADRVITVSNLTRQVVIQKYGISPEKVVTVHNAVCPGHVFLPDFPPKPFPQKVVTFLGRITVQKGPGFFIDAAAMVMNRLPDVRFVMAGSGDLAEQMIRRAAVLNLSGRFHFPGFLKENEVYRMFRMSDVYVMPSVSEPFGITPLEALQAGVPVIISKQSGVSEILEHAIKVDYWDTEALADVICCVLEYPALSSYLVEKGREEIKRLSWEDTATKIRSVYEAVISSRRAGKARLALPPKRKEMHRRRTGHVVKHK